MVELFWLIRVQATSFRVSEDAHASLNTHHCIGVLDNLKLTVPSRGRYIGAGEGERALRFGKWPPGGVSGAPLSRRTVTGAGD